MPQDNFQEPKPQRLSKAQLEFLGNIAQQVAIIGSKFYGIATDLQRIYEHIDRNEKESKERDKRQDQDINDRLTRELNRISDDKKEVITRLDGVEGKVADIVKKMDKQQGREETLMFIGGIIGAILLALFTHLLSKTK